MKIPITTIQRNAYDYLATIASVCPEDEAEFYLVTQDGDKVENDELHGLVLTRKGVRYSQNTEMKHFRGMGFYPIERTQEGKTVSLKLIRA